MEESLSKEILAEIKRLAGLFFTPREVAIALELDEEKFVIDCELKTSEAYKAFYGGRLQGMLDARGIIIKMAKSGSTPAQTLLMDIIVDSKIKMMDK